MKTFNDAAVEQFLRDLIKLIIVTGASFAKVANSTKRKDNGEPPFGQRGSTSYISAKRTTLRSLERSYKSYNKGSTRSTWTPLDTTYSTSDFLLPSKLLEDLNSIFRSRFDANTPTPTIMSSKRTTSSSLSDASSTREVSNFHVDGECGHVYVKMSLKELKRFREVNPEAVQAFIGAAKVANFGENAALQNLFIEHLDEVKTPDNMHNVQVLDVTKFNIPGEQVHDYKMAFHGDLLFFQVPLSDRASMVSVIPVISTLQHQTTQIVESKRNDAYRKLRSDRCNMKENEIGVKTYAFKLPDGMQFGDPTDPRLFQKQSKKKFKFGDLSAYATKVPSTTIWDANVIDKASIDAIDLLLDQMVDLGIFDDADTARNTLFSIPIYSVSWQIPIDCEKILIAEDPSSSDDDASVLNCTDIMEELEAMEKSTSKTPPRNAGTGQLPTLHEHIQIGLPPLPDSPDDMKIDLPPLPESPVNNDNNGGNDGSSIHSTLEKLETLVEDGKNDIKDGVALLAATSSTPSNEEKTEEEPWKNMKSPSLIVEKGKNDRKESQHSVSKDARKRVVDEKRSKMYNFLSSFNK